MIEWHCGGVSVGEKLPAQGAREKKKIGELLRLVLC
jgi:hypothetical protein